jgi:hypothetical protein
MQANRPLNERSLFLWEEEPAGRRYVDACTQLQRELPHEGEEDDGYEEYDYRKNG